MAEVPQAKTGRNLQVETHTYTAIIWTICKQGQLDKNAVEDKTILRRSKWLKTNVVF